MKTPFIQPDAGNCGLYTLANLFQYEGFLSHCRPKGAQDVHELNQYLVPHIHFEAYLCADYLLPLGAGRITDHTIVYRFESDEEADTGSNPARCLAYVLGISNPENTMLHYVGVVHQACKGGRFWVVDSTRPAVEETTPAEYFANTWVTAIINLRMMDGPDKGLAVTWPIGIFDHLTGPVNSNVAEAPVITPLEKKWTVSCDVCGQLYDDWAGSTPCCGSVASIINPDGSKGGWALFGAVTPAAQSDAPEPLPTPTNG